MLLRPFIAVAGLTAAANAFLVAPELSAHEVDAFESLPVESIAAAQGQTINLECAGCPPVFNKHKKHDNHKGPHHKEHVSHLELDFTTEQGRLSVNGFELYPHSDPFTNILVAPLVAEKPQHHNKHDKHDKHSKHGKHDKHSKDGEDDTKEVKGHHKYQPHDGKPKSVQQQLGFSLQVQPVITTADDMELVVVDLQVIEVGSVFVDGLPNVRVHLINTPGNELMIAKIEKTVSETTPTPAEPDMNECTTLLCKWRAIVAAQLAKVKLHGCAGMMGAKAGHGHAHDNFRGQHPGQHPGHMGHGRQHGWALLFRKLTSHIILPVLVGIVAGVSVSILGMLVGTILVGMWRKFVRGQSFFPTHHCRRFGRSSHHKASRHEVALPEEKSVLMAVTSEELPPPRYEDEPATEHVEHV